MQVNLLLVILVGLAPLFQETTTAVNRSQTPVELWCGGDDNLTQGVCRAVFREFATSPDFRVSNGEEPGSLIVTIPTNVDWKERGKRTRVFYIVEFTSTHEKKLGTRKGACWDNDFRACATQIVKHAKIAARKLPPIVKRASNQRS